MAGPRQGVTGTASEAKSARRPSPSVSREQIAKVALTYLDRHGLGALSMRRLAGELGIGTMTLYHYFRTKRELLDAVVDVAVAELQPPSLAGTWRAQITGMVKAARAQLSRHPSLVQIRVMHPVLRPEALRSSEVGFRILEEAGFPPDEAANAYRLLFTYTFGFAAFSPAGAEEEAREAALAAIAALPPEYYPRLSSAVEEAAAAMAGDATFDYGLERILDGLEARLAALGAAGPS